MEKDILDVVQDDTANVLQFQKALKSLRRAAKMNNFDSPLNFWATMYSLDFSMKTLRNKYL